MKALIQTNSTGLPLFACVATCRCRCCCGGGDVGRDGCQQLAIHTVAVNKTVLAPHVLDATLEQLNSQLGAQYAAVKSLNAKVSIKVATGGKTEGEVHEVIPTFSG